MTTSQSMSMSIRVFPTDREGTVDVVFGNQHAVVDKQAKAEVRA